MFCMKQFWCNFFLYFKGQMDHVLVSVNVEDQSIPKWRIETNEKGNRTLNVEGYKCRYGSVAQNNYHWYYGYCRTLG